MHQNIEAIIVRKLDGRASTAELSELEDWLAQSPENRQEYNAIVRIWKESIIAASGHDYDTRAAWDKVSRRIQEPVGIYRFMNQNIIISVAACLIIAFGLATLFFDDWGKKEGVWKEIIAADHQVIELPDGSKVSLRKGSVFQYQNDFGKKSRKTKFQGEAYFEISHNDDMPFEILTRQGVFTDLGTAFLLRAQDSVDRVVVKEGAVHIESRLNSKQEMVVKPGQRGELKGTALIKREDKGENLLSWQKNRLQFRQTSLSDVVEDLEHYYGVPFRMEPGLGADSVKVTVSFEGQALVAVLEELELVTGFSFSFRESHVVVGRLQQ